MTSEPPTPATPPHATPGPAAPQPPESDPPRRAARSATATKKQRRQLPLWAHFVLALVLVAVLRNFVGQSFYVPSGSMIPTLEVGDRVVVSKLGDDYQRGDVVVFDGTDTFGGGSTERFTGAFGSVVDAVAGIFGINPGEKDYVKRIAAVGGDRIVCCDADGKITINGTAVDEPYLPPGTEPSTQEFDLVVPAGHFFMLGDNRANSADSRAHLGGPGGGFIDKADVIGKPVLQYWPLDRFGRTPQWHADSLSRIGAGSGG